LNDDTGLTEVSLDELIRMILDWMAANGMLDELIEKYGDKE